MYYRHHHKKPTTSNLNPPDNQTLAKSRTNVYHKKTYKVSLTEQILYFISYIFSDTTLMNET